MTLYPSNNPNDKNPSWLAKIHNDGDDETDVEVRWIIRVTATSWNVREDDVDDD